MRRRRRGRHARTRRAIALGTLAIAYAFASAPSGVLPSSKGAAPRDVLDSSIEAAIERQPVCVGAVEDDAGNVADSIYYRAVQTSDGRVAVGYFVFFSEERPWGNNWLTWTVLPALAVDMFYSRSLLILPGIQRALFGKGDVEGFRVVYDRDAKDVLHVVSGFADDGTHDPVPLTRDDVLALDPGKPTFYSTVWSHQLGGHGLKSKGDLASLQCFDRGHILPLPADVERDFNVARRAPPAHVERLADVVRTIGEGPSPLSFAIEPR